MTQTFSLIQTLPLPADHPNIRALAQWKVERFTGLTGTTITTINKIVSGQEQLFKNGALLDFATAYTVSGNTITLAAALITSDVVILRYLFRQS